MSFLLSNNVTIYNFRAVQGHRNILNVLDTYEEEKDKKTEFWIVTELCELGNLAVYVEDYIVETEHKLDIMEQISSGLAYLHHIKV